MIQIDEISISEFRGIRDMTLSLGYESFVVWGPNGSGKSGVIDAIDFALTGKISRLGGPGSKNITVLQHGPHVHSRKAPANSKVSLKVRETTSNKTATLTRCVKTTTKYTLEPDIPEIRAAVERAALHSELTLSRREIIKFVLTQPSDRADAVQALLKLERLGKVRDTFKTLQSRAEKEAQQAAAIRRNCEEELKRHVGITSLTDSEIIAAVNKQRVILGLEEIKTVPSGVDFRVDVDGDSSLSAFNQTSAVRDVTALLKAVRDSSELRALTNELAEKLGSVESADTAFFDKLQHRELVELGISTVADARCPLCDLAWPTVDELRAHLTEKLAGLEEAKQLESSISALSQKVGTSIDRVRSLVRPIIPIISMQGAGAALQLQLESWSENLGEFKIKLESVNARTTQRHRLMQDPLALPRGLEREIEAFLGELKARPDESATARARSFLLVAQDRWDRLQSSISSHQVSAVRKMAADSIHDAYCNVMEAALVELYRTVEDDFSAFYREINNDDEAEFSAKLKPSKGSLDLSVDFHGLGMFPPAAYHSEGHQDGMGVCLYLALLKQILGTDFRLSVLDDVVMSVDSNHRRQFCELLKTRFPQVQFIITTHDQVWARQMVSAGLIDRSAQARLYGWTVDTGPTYEKSQDVWTDIDSALDKNDVSAAAARLRRFLEATLADLAGALRGKVVFRADGNYELNDLLSAVTGKYKDLLRTAANSANSWNNSNAKVGIESLKSAFSEIDVTRQSENWIVNITVHNNDWAEVSSADFRPVVVAWKKYVDTFFCESCKSYIYVVGRPDEALRCSCAAFTLNLRTK